MSFYDQFRTIPQAFIDLGMLVPVTLVRTTGAFDPRTMSKAAGTVTINAHGVLSVRKTRANDGTIVTATVAKLTVEPKLGDKLTIGSQTLTVDEITTIAPDGTAIFFEAVVS